MEGWENEEEDGKWSRMHGRMALKPLLPPLTTTLTAKQIRHACGSACVCVSVLRGKTRERKRESAGRCLRSLCGRLQAVCRGQRETREAEQRKKDREKERQRERDRGRERERGGLK